MNLIRDEVRRIGRHPAPSELSQDLPSELRSPFEEAVRAEDVRRYHLALGKMPSRDRELIVARIEAQWSYDEIAAALHDADLRCGADGGDPRAQRLMDTSGRSSTPADPEPRLVGDDHRASAGVRAQHVRRQRFAQVHLRLAIVDWVHSYLITLNSS
jgi:hypothetical protein